MSNDNITTSQNLLKRLEEDMVFLSGIMSQVNGLAVQVIFVSSSIKRIWAAIDKAHKDWKRDIERSQGKELRKKNKK